MLGLVITQPLSEVLVEMKNSSMVSEENKTLINSDVSKKVLSLPGVHILKNYLKDTNSLKTIHNLLQPTENILSFKKNSEHIEAEKLMELEKRREYLLRKHQTKEYNRMVHGQEK